MLAAHRVYIAFGVVATVVTCTQTGMRGMRDYNGVALERVKELPEVAAFVPKGSASGVSVSSSERDPFAGACAQTLRITKDGRELRLMQSTTATRESNQDGSVTTRLVSAVGEYAVVTPEWLRGGSSPRLRVDCVRGRATGWVGEPS